MKSFSFLFIIVFIVSCNNNNTNSNDLTIPSTYEEKRKSLAEIEQESPTNFLKVEGTYRTNLVGRWVLEGSIFNTATTARYKDVVLEITYYSKTNTYLGSETKVFYEYFEPNSEKKFKIKVDGYGGTEKIGYNISSAIAVY